MGGYSGSATVMTGSALLYVNTEKIPSSVCFCRFPHLCRLIRGSTYIYNPLGLLILGKNTIYTPFKICRTYSTFFFLKSLFSSSSCCKILFRNVKNWFCSLKFNYGFTLLGLSAFFSIKRQKNDCVIYGYYTLLLARLITEIVCTRLIANQMWLDSHLTRRTSSLNL